MLEALLPSFLITFREALEAILIVAIMLSYLKKIGKGNLSKYVYLGSLGGVLTSLLLGLAIQAVYGGLNDLTGQLFEGFASLTAVVVLTYMIIWMTEHSRDIKGELQERMDVVVSRGELYGITTLAFVAVFREGLETVLFLSTTFFQDSTGTTLGIFAGFTIVLALAVLLMRGSYNLDLKRFFRYTSILLVVFAAGLAGYGIHELIEAGEAMGVNIGVLGDHAFDINPPLNTDGSYPPFHERGVVGSILKALIGYDGNPEWLRVLVYIGYWLAIGGYIYYERRKKISYPIIGPEHSPAP